MINLKKVRLKDGQTYNYCDGAINVSDALRVLMKFELGYGGEITTFFETEIVVTTRVFGCIDTVTFTGDAEDMQTLHSACYFFMKSSEDFADEIFDASFKKAEKMDSVGERYEGVSPLFAQIGFPLIVGENRLKAALMYSVGIDAREDVLMGMSADFEDLMVGIQMQLEGACTLQEALS